MSSRRTQPPSLDAPTYGRTLPTLTVNLIVRDLPCSLEFYRDVLLAEVVFADPDFAAVRLGGRDMMLHADHTYDGHAWWPELADGARRGLGAEVRLLGLDPEQAHARARRAGARVLKAPWHTPHGWYETTIEDPDGYAWAVGVKLPG